MGAVVARAGVRSLVVDLLHAAMLRTPSAAMRIHKSCELVSCEGGGGKERAGDGRGAPAAQHGICLRRPAQARQGPLRRNSSKRSMPARRQQQRSGNTPQPQQAREASEGQPLASAHRVRASPRLGQRKGLRRRTERAHCGRRTVGWHAKCPCHPTARSPRYETWRFTPEIDHGGASGSLLTGKSNSYDFYRMH